MPNAQDQPLLLLVGPTAVGKTEAALQLTGRLPAEIVSADSRQFYRGMDIGTAKPTAQEQKLATHHLIDIAAPNEIISLADFQERARQAIAGIHARGRLPILVGGAGQYVRAVVQGWQPPAVAPDKRLRQVLETWAMAIGGDGLHARLAAIDPLAAQNIDARNLRRTIRALEVIFTTGRLFSAQRARAPSPYRLLTIGLWRPRTELYARIDARIQGMLDAGLVAEVQKLLDAGFAPELPSLSAIGYREIVAYLNGQIPLVEAVRQLKHSTRVYVRRQANWFKMDDPDIHWLPASADIANRIEALVRPWLQRDSENGSPTESANDGNS